MDLGKLKSEIDLIVIRFEKQYQPDNRSVSIQKSVYYKILRDWIPNLIVFGTERLIEYFSAWRKNEWIHKLAHYSKAISEREDYGNELFKLYSTLEINDTLIRHLSNVFQKDITRLRESTIVNEEMISLQKGLEEFDEIAEKLEYLKEFYQTQIEGKIEVPALFNDTPIGRKAFESIKKDKIMEVSSELFPETEWFYTPLGIPEYIYKFNFEFAQDDPDYAYWFLEYNAKLYFENQILYDLDNELNSPLKNVHISVLLSELEAEKQRVLELVEKREISSYSEIINDKYIEEVELLRILEEYYKTIPLKLVNDKNNTTVKIFARHHFLKPYLEKILFNLKNPYNPKGFKDFFARPYQYEFVMEQLVENKKCQVGTNKWCDKRAGYKSYLIGLFKVLHLKGYFLDKTGMSLKQMKDVALNTFGIDISIDTVKHATEPDIHGYEYIPVASSLSERH